MTTMNVIGLLVAGWAIGDIITMTTLVLNRRKVRGLINLYVRQKQAEAVQAYVAEQDSANSSEEEGFDDFDCDDDCSNCN